MKCGKNYWYLTLPVFALLATPALAQETDTGGVEDITVTAQRRSESQQDVPISVTTVTAEAAERQGVTGTETLTTAVPSLQFSRQTGNGGTPFIRGIGNAEGSGGAESGVAVYIDDVYIGTPSSTLFEFNNIDSVEVLKGPQGTLFGRNATGGVVSVHTRRPDREPGADLRVGYGSYNTHWGSLYATGGLSENVAMNFALSGRDQTEGYGRNLVTGEDTLLGWNWGARSQLLWEPGINTEVLLTGDYSRRQDDTGMSVGIYPGTVGSGGGTFQDQFGTFDTPNDFSRTAAWGLSGRVTHDFGALSLVSITAYRDSTLDWRLDGDGSPTGTNILGITYHLEENAFTQEFQLLSPDDGPFRWIAGLFYYRSEAAYDPHTLFGSAQAGNGGGRNLYTQQETESLAGFAEATWEFLPNTSLTGGVRYTSDESSLERQIVTYSNIVTNPAPGSLESSQPTYRVTLDHRFTPDIMAYASYSTGFKSGRFNALLSGTAVDPETIDAYEVGFKADLFDNHFRLNASAFHYDYQDLQVTIVVVGGSEVLNAAAAEIDGFDVEWNFVPTSNFELRGGISILDASYTEFPDGPFLIANPATCTPTPTTTGAPTGGFLTCSVDLAGNRLSRAPELTMSLLGTYTIPTSIGDFDLTASWYHNDGFFWEPDNNFAQPSYDLVGASVTWSSPDERYDLRVYGRNLTDDYYYNYYSTGGLRAAFSPAMPTNYGIELGVHF